jgi:hypothetical protein
VLGVVHSFILKTLVHRANGSAEATSAYRSVCTRAQDVASIVTSAGGGEEESGKKALEDAVGFHFFFFYPG